MLNTDPFALLSDLERQFYRVGSAAPTRPTWLPATDVIAGEHEVRVVIDAPGVSREDLSIEVREGSLIIAGDRKPAELAGVTAQRIERGWGRWSRAVRLRDGLDLDAISADLADGVLTVTLPVAERARPRRIPIGAGDHRELSTAAG